MSAPQISIAFVLPSAGGGGGSHSVVQECIGLTKLGASVTIVTLDRHFASFRANYPELGNYGIPLHGVSSDQQLGDVLAKYQLAVATTFESVFLLKDALAKIGGKRPKSAYYVQDYEPFFHAPGTERWDRAKTSYSAIPDCLLFAKTRFLCEIVYQNTGKLVEKVSPSIDHEVYYAGGSGGNPNRVTISAMMRPKTPRRAPWRTLRVMEELKARFQSDNVDIVCFGSSRSELMEFGLRPSDGIQILGHLSRKEVANILRSSDLFLDLSDYQAFGRTGLEGMACGCVPVLPVFGGTDEYAKHWQNSILLDPRDEENIVQEVGVYLKLPEQTRSDMRIAALRTATEYSIQKAALTELEAFRQFVLG